MKTREDIEVEFEKLKGRIESSGMKPTDLVASIQAATLLEIACQLADLNASVRCPVCYMLRGQNHAIDCKIAAGEVR